MKRLTIVLFLISTTLLNSFSQKRDEKIYEKVDIYPEFIYSGCDRTEDCIDLFVDTYKKWPPFEGSFKATIIIQCLVEKNGKLTDFKILRGVETHFDKASIDVLKTMPLWKPGRIKGRKVRTQITIRVKWEG